MAKQLQIEETTARRLYPTATPEFKQMLEDTFGKDFFQMKITDRIKTYEDACRELGEQSIDENRLAKPLLTPDEILLRKIKTITKALNEGWVPDWKNADQKKHYPYFRLSSGAVAFFDADCDCSSADAGAASRLCFKSSELAEYAGKQFLQLYSDYILYYQ